MDPFVIIKALNVAMLLVIGTALYVFWRSSDRTPFLLHWSLYEFALAAAVVVDGYILPASIAVGVAVSVLLLGILGYRKQRQPTRYAFLLMFLVIALPGYGLAEGLGRTYGLIYLVMAMSVGYLAAATLFYKAGGALNTFIAVAFLARAANILLYPLWEMQHALHITYAIGQILTLMAGVGLLMAGFSKAYSALQKRERELAGAYHQSEELTVKLEHRNEEYLQARHHAEAADAAKSQFLANMSHELRTPLNAILGFSEVLAVLPREQAMEKLRAYARDIHHSASGLQSMIDEILNLSRVEAGVLNADPKTCDLNDVLDDILRALRPLAEEKEISLARTAAAPCLARCDCQLTRQALINGISNAIKYTQRGGAIICSTQTDGKNAIATVEDNGIGIDETRLGKAFDPFWQEGNSFVAENNGVGLGLTIAKSYIEVQGGSIELSRAGERGTLFRVILPAAEAASLPDTPSDTAPDAPRAESLAS
ncbi:HAMP domain-containing histidine kinase [Pelagibius litoralis]|uniref:histidine kinase n=1 Tax=Pelagibius litoralis TaxID=374515 RepID=A0A967F3C1_9PROT|nr:HAMP domain-containing sensor histidine kinase [Pelagibius litoralis]NIA72468.1 HAMP domain-containing histidine kinase [Pelagibius litoralis]